MPLTFASKFGAVVTIILLNDMDAPLMVEFEFTGPIIFTPSSAALPPAGSTQVTVTVRSTQAVGQATVTAIGRRERHFEDAEVLSLPVAIGSTGSTPVPRVSSVKIHSTWGLFGDTVGASVPLVDGDCSTLNYATDTPVGYVQAASGLRSRVLATCAGVKGSAYLQLSLPGLADTGATYDGDGTFGATKVSISVQRSSSTFQPLVALALGVLLAMWVLKRGPARVIAGLRSRLLVALAAIGSSANPGSAIVKFRQVSGGADWGNLDLFADAIARAEAIGADITRLRDEKRFSLKPDDVIVTAISAGISTLEAVGPNLVSLATALVALQNGLPIIEASRLLPTGTNGIREELRQRRTLTVDELVAFVAATESEAAIIAWFPSVAQQIRAAEDRLEQLNRNVVQRPAVDQAKLANAQGLIDAALAQFGRAVTSDDVRAAYADEFTTARRAVDELGSMEILAPGGVAALDQLRPPALLSMSLPPPEVLTHEAQTIVAEERAASLVAILVVSGLLLFAGLQALVIGKTFGTIWDFAAAIAWGSATLTVASPLATAIEGYTQIRSRST
jgi:hypothetical protein